MVHLLLELNSLFFLAKNQLLYKVPESIKIQRLYNSCTSKDFNGLLYSTRAVKICIKEQILLDV